MSNLRYYFLTLLLLALCAFQCNKDVESNVYTGKVELEGVCSRMVVSFTGGNLAALPPNSFAASWRDESTGITYQNVFMIANFCQALGVLQAQPLVLKQGDQITFRVQPNPDPNCISCMAYSPAPDKQLAIEIISK
jgi:hypothetical protein